MRWDNMGFNYAEGKETSKNVLVCLCQKTPDGQNVQETKDGSYTMISQLTYFSSALWMEIKPCQCANASLAVHQCCFEGQHYYHGSASLIRNSQY